MKFPDLNSLLTVEEQFEAVIEGAELMTPAPREQWPAHIAYVPKEETVANVRVLFDNCLILGRESANMAALVNPMPWSGETAAENMATLHGLIDRKLSEVDTSDVRTLDMFEAMHRVNSVFREGVIAAYTERLDELSVSGRSDRNGRKP